MRKVICKCDSCGKEFNNVGDITKISVDVVGKLKIRKMYGEDAVKSFDICDDCLRKKGFIIEQAQDAESYLKQENSNRETLEDKIYEILSDLGVAFEK